MKRNRSIRTLPLENLSLLHHPPPETPNNKEKLYFGEKIEENVPNLSKIGHNLSSDDSFDTILQGIRDLGTGKSSSSSLSWGDEYKSETSQQVKEELERMDRVLMGLEPIPQNYNEQEYREWMEFFPSLCILGKSVINPPKEGCDNIKTTSKSKTGTVIDSICPVIKIDDYLKISPLGGTSQQPLLLHRQSSTRSLVSSQIYSSKWLKDESEYNSLPFLVGGSACGIKHRVKPKSILKNSLVLPPIDNGQFRSISATPRWECKSLSAIALKEKQQNMKLFSKEKTNIKKKLLRTAAIRD